MSALPVAAKFHIKRGDVVEAISGEDAVAGKTGKVLKIHRADARAVVEGFNFIKKAVRKSQDNPKGGIIEKEAPIAISNLRRVEESKAAPAARKAPPRGRKPGGEGKAK